VGVGAELQVVAILLAVVARFGFVLQLQLAARVAKIAVVAIRTFPCAAFQKFRKLDFGASRLIDDCERDCVDWDCEAAWGTLGSDADEGPEALAEGEVRGRLRKLLLANCCSNRPSLYSSVLMVSRDSCYEIRNPNPKLKPKPNANPIPKKQQQQQQQQPNPISKRTKTKTNTNDKNI
jgi:hypothetical protein